MLIRIAIFISYTFVYFFMALMMTGGGHGNWVFLTAPLLTWILSFVAICLTNWLEDQFIRICFVLVLLIHYLFIAFNCYGYFQSEYFLTKDIKHFSLFGYLLMFTIFLSGQIYIWSFWFKQNNTVEKENLNIL